MRNKNSSKPSQEKSTSFIKTLAGRITTLATFIVALSVLYAALERTGAVDWVIGITRKRHDIHYQLYIKAARVMPYSLKNSIGSKEFPYWFLISMRNMETRPVTVQIAFNDYSGPGRLKIKSKVFPDVGPDSMLSETVDPFDLMIDDIEEGINDRIRTTVRVLDSEEKILQQCDHEFELLPKNILAWDLKTPDQKPVSHDYLVATLSAWVLAPHKSVKDCSEHVSELVHPDTDQDSLAMQWFSKCYSSVFQEYSVQVQSMIGRFPAKKGGKRQIIRTPSQVLRHCVANPLEAALLLGSLTKKQQALHKISQLVLLALADEGDMEKSFFLCWLTGNRWHGLNMNLAGKNTYADNVADASQRVRLFLQNSPNILNKLELRGVYVDDSVVALDFDRAKKTFGIRALP